MNTWHCISLDADPVVDATNFVDALATFYHAIDGQMSGRLSGDLIFDVYDLEDASPRVPIHHDEIGLALGTGDGVPNECAVFLSYHGALVSGINPARHRGRIYLGPWDVSNVDQGAGDSIVSATLRDMINANAEILMDTTTVAGNPWAVFSPTTAGNPPWSPTAISDATFQVQGGWVDDAWDIIRKRGARAASRAIFPV